MYDIAMQNVSKLIKQLCSKINMGDEDALAVIKTEVGDGDLTAGECIKILEAMADVIG